MQMLGQHADVAEERSENVEFLGEQFDPLLQQIVVFHQQLDLLLGLARSHLRLLAALPHGDVIPLPPSSVLVARLVDGLALLPGDVGGGGVMLMGYYRSFHRAAPRRRLMNRRAGMTAGHRGRCQGGEGLTAIGERIVRHRAVTWRILRAVASIVRRVQRLFLDAGRFRARTVTIATAALMIIRATVHWLRHVCEGSARVIIARSHVLHAVAGIQHV